jgi:anti-sigma28 factor (negative regulator of flagellin synthesis)
MRIVDNNTPGNTSLQQTTRTAQTQAAGSVAKGSSNDPSSSSADGLQLSRFAGTLSEVMQSDSATRAQRVTQLSAAYKSGSYQVDAAAVSRAIVDQVISGGKDDQ